MELTITLPLGEHIFLPDGWTLRDWSLTLHGEGLTSNGTIAMETGYREVSFSPGQSWVDESSDLSTAAACAEARASAPGRNGQVTITTIDGVTYHQVGPEWYLDHEGQAYRLAHASRGQGANQFEADVMESVDWTGCYGTAVCLPTGACVGLDVTAEWTISSEFWFTPPGGSRNDDRVGLFLTVGGARFGLTENTGSDEVTATPIGEQTVRGITYHGTTWSPYDPALGPDFQTWDFMHFGHTLRLHGSTSSMSALMDAVSWDKAVFKMELDHLEHFKNWLRQLSGVVHARAGSTQGPSVIEHIDDYMKTAGIDGDIYRSGPISGIREASKSLFRTYDTTFTKSSAEIQRIIDRTLNENRRGLTYRQRIQQDAEYRDTYGPVDLRASDTPPDLRSKPPAKKPIRKVEVGPVLYRIGKRECHWDGEDLTFSHLYKSSARAIHNDPGLALTPIEESKPVSATPEWWSALSVTAWANAGISEVLGVNLLDRLGKEVAGDWGQLHRVARCLRQLATYCQRYYESLDKALSYVFNGWKGYEAETACASFLRNLAVIDAHRASFEEVAEAFDSIAYTVEQYAEFVESSTAFTVDLFVPLPHKILTVASFLLGGGDTALKYVDFDAAKMPDLDSVYSGNIDLPPPVAYADPMV